MYFISKLFTAFMVMLVGLSAANAGVVIGGTRVIYDGNKKEASVSVNNPDSEPYLIQSWIEMPNGGTGKAPFIVTPPLYRLDKSQQNVERIVMTGAVTQDKESLYWLNIKAIPSAERKDNSLQIAVKTRIKLIYRPVKLEKINLDEQAPKLIWQRIGNDIQVKNPGNYIINFNEISLGDKKIENVTYVMPGETTRFQLPVGATDNNVTFKMINDHGGTSKLYHASF